MVSVYLKKDGNVVRWDKKGKIPDGENVVRCDECGKRWFRHSSTTTGYATNPEKGAFCCFDCMGHRDKCDLIKLPFGQKTYLYLSGNQKDGYILSNWPETLKISVFSHKIRRHNIARQRIDVWFVLDAQWYHGVQYGDFTQICHVEKTRQCYIPADGVQE